MSIPSAFLVHTGFTVSRLGLGTAEIGLPYGIGVKKLPSDREAERILKAALELGITYFDTARGYGVAEERLGKFGITRREGVVIGTKCAQFLKQEPHLSGHELAARIREDIDASRRALRQDTLQLVQLHLEREDATGFDEFVAIMRQLKDEGAVAHVGISTRGETAPLAAFAADFFETLQIAYSILDQRMDSPPLTKGGTEGGSILQLARQANIGVINRSVLLKGALTPAAERLPDQLAPLKENARRAAAIAAELATDLPSLAIRFAASHPAISTILIGTTTPAHLATAAAALTAGSLPHDALTQLHTLAIDDPTQVDPAQWPPIT